MKLADMICFESVIVRLKSKNRDDVIRDLIQGLYKAGKITKSASESLAKSVIKRENEASTGIGKGVAVPHAKFSDIQDPIATIGCSSEGIDFSSLDKQPVYTVILLLSPAGNPDKHLQVMETIFRYLHKDDFRRFLRQAQSVQEIKEVIVDADGDAME